MSIVSIPRPPLLTVRRFHDFSAGHRVVGHEGKCIGIHGHNYRIHFECIAAALDDLGRVIDFSVIKSKLCNWLEDTWDHRTLLWEKDPIARDLLNIAFNPNIEGWLGNEFLMAINNSVVMVPFNPLAEQMAEYLLTTVGPVQLKDTGVTLIRVQVDETRKCSATAQLPGI